MSKGETYKNQYLLHLFNNANIPGIGDGTGLRGSSSVGSLYVALHTANPAGAGNDQTTFEISYTGYARVPLLRDSSCFVVAGAVAAFTSTVTFPLMTGGAGGTATHFSIGVAASGASMLLYSGTISASLSVTNGVFPGLLSGAVITEQ